MYLSFCKQTVVLVATTWVLMSCETLVSPKTETLFVAISFDQPKRPRFSGKGAGAGMMLSSSMGAVGVAIGIAIDEGIGKDIHTTAKAGGVEVESLVTELLQQTAHRLDRPLYVATTADADVFIHIERYGFILQPGKDDATSAQFTLMITASETKGAKALSLNYPKDFIGANTTPVSTLPLARLKSNAVDIDYLWRDALVKVFSDSRFESILALSPAGKHP